LEFFRLFLVKSLFGFFDKGKHISHAQYTRRHSVGVERFEVSRFFSRSHKFYGFARDVFYGKCRTAAGVAVGLCKNDARYVKRLVKTFCHRYGILTCHCVNRQQYLVRFDCGFDVLQLVHKNFVDVKTSRRVEENNIVAVVFCMSNRSFCYINGICTLRLSKNGNPEFFTENLQLQYRRGSVNVAGNEQGTFAEIFEVKRKFCAMRGFARALKTAEHNDRRTF